MNNVCQSCGAPSRPGIILCEYCESPIDLEAAKRAIPCRQCSLLNVESAQQCMKCKQWLVVQCLFCAHVTPHTMPACRQCNEPFAGAAERRAQRDSQQQRQQMFNTVGAVAPIAGSLLGGVAGALLGNAFGSSGHSHSGDHYSGGHGHHGGSSDSWSGTSRGRDDSSGGIFESVSESLSEVIESDDDESNSRG